MSTKHSKIPVHIANMSPRLLQLPDELLNKIFEYALTIDDGICYREDNLGVGRLCLHPQEPKRDVKKHSHTLAPVASVHESDDEAPTRKRRKIAETDRTIGKSMVGTEKTMRRGVVTVNGHVVANQLQFVNKQLRNQTRALAIRFNDVYILETCEHVIKFVYSVTGHMRLWIQKVILRVAHATFNSLHNLKLDEEMHSRNFAFTNAPCSVLELPSCVKVFPWDKDLDEAAIRRFCEEDGIEKRWLVPFLPGGVGDLLAVAKEWFEEGY